MVHLKEAVLFLAVIALVANGWQPLLAMSGAIEVSAQGSNMTGRHTTK